ncbi:hypothetical protein JTB14_010798 [Gonioctena quinquepunctata]|nr:hypothetical protein JTB14_010798 [Gonioctena quinquepunctata]
MDENSDSFWILEVQAISKIFIDKRILNSRMAFKVTGNHWDIIINFMELHPDLARGRIDGPCGKDTFKRLWTELTLELKATGLGERPVQKWQKTWTDFKYALKKEASDIKADLNGTGGGPARGSNLTDLENRILNLLGKTFYKGLGRAENGCNFMDQSYQETGQQQRRAQNEMVTKFHHSENLLGPSQEHSDVNESVNFSNGQTHKLDSSIQQQKQKDYLLTNNSKDTLKAIHDRKKSILAEHSYTSTPSSGRTRKVHPEKKWRCCMWKHYQS